LRQDTASAKLLGDDRTDDYAFGAMMSLALRRKFRKLRFQMIADSSLPEMASERKLFLGSFGLFHRMPTGALNSCIMHLMRFERLLSFAMLQDF
jgi:hypothetical protein